VEKTMQARCLFHVKDQNYSDTAAASLLLALPDQGGKCPINSPFESTTGELPQKGTMTSMTRNEYQALAQAACTENQVTSCWNRMGSEHVWLTMASMHTQLCYNHNEGGL